jgi:YaiO family outer membrane protein
MMEGRHIARVCTALTLCVSAQGAAAQAVSYEWAAAAYEHSRFREDIEPWHLAALEVGARRAAGAAMLRGSAAERFGIRGTQAELEAYPVLAAATYGMLLAGVSNARLFPKWHVGAELFTSPRRGLELSAGARHHAFDDAVTIVTGSVGVYPGKWHLLGRPFVSRQAGSTSYAGFLRARRLYDDGESWLGARVSAGAAPTRLLTEAELGRTSAFGVTAEGRARLRPRTLLGADLGFEREQLPGDAERSRIVLGVRLEQRF